MSSILTLIGIISFIGAVYEINKEKNTKNNLNSTNKNKKSNKNNNISNNKLNKYDINKDKKNSLINMKNKGSNDKLNNNIDKKYKIYLNDGVNLYIKIDNYGYIVEPSQIKEYIYDEKELIKYNIKYFDEHFDKDLLNDYNNMSYLDKLSYDRIISKDRQVSRDNIINNVVILFRCCKFSETNKYISTSSSNELNYPYNPENDHGFEWMIRNNYYNSDDNKIYISECNKYIVGQIFKDNSNEVIYFLFNYTYETYNSYGYINIGGVNDFGEFITGDSNLSTNVEYFDTYEDMIACIVYKKIASYDLLCRKMFFYDKKQKDMLIKLSFQI